MSLAAAHHHNTHRHPDWDRARAGRLGMLLFLAALGMLFLGGLLGYVLIRVRGMDRLPLHTLALPLGVWISTPLMLGASLLLEIATRAARREQGRRFHRALVAAALLILAFLIAQCLTLADLLQMHEAVRASGLALYGLAFVLILLHAAHVFGGLVPLGLVIRGAWLDRYDHEHWWPIRLTAMYWHFLDVVWLVMLAVLGGLG